MDLSAEVMIGEDSPVALKIKTQITKAEPSQADSESGWGQQQAHSSFTAASHKHTSVGQQSTHQRQRDLLTAEFAAFEGGTETL